ncbi:SDR family oxidoreductase [Saccharibacillus kuerlensis]|uniref:NAD(P)-dependent oxidoreductase n=1 Tax=Saccharibacillus kuerlensis TaxID=459527 RepID=A0ABQ2KSM7_9BACL|nr:SDR family oxidoreductase [Saccharibacillus kuerlensis]GGN91992.1 NAD(P)-dependent oxidoreductase [Saccharibacillus kuerlensis]
MSANEGKIQTPPAQQQKQDSHGKETEMTPQPIVINEHYKAAGKLTGMTAIITGGDSGIGRSVAVHYAREGADVAIVYLKGHEDAEETKKMVEAEGRSCLLLSGDIGDEMFAQEAIRRTMDKFGKLDIIVNNAAEQHPQSSIEDITAEQLERTFRTNIFAMFYLTKAALPHLKEGSSIINTTSINAYRGNAGLLDYSSTKGAIVSFTRSLSMNLAEQKIRVNGVAPGPIWTPLIPSTYPAEEVKSFGGNQPLGRVGQPADLGPAYVYLASTDSSYVTGQVIHVNGGEVING